MLWRAPAPAPCDQRAVLCQASTSGSSGSGGASRPAGSRRLQQLQELDLDDGWGVAAPAPSTPAGAPPSPAPGGPAKAAPAAGQAPRSASSSNSQAQGGAGGGDAAGGGPPKQRLGRAAVKAAALQAQVEAQTKEAKAVAQGQTPAAPQAPPKKPRAAYMDLKSEQGLLGLALLNARLRSEGGGCMAGCVLLGVWVGERMASWGTRSA